MTGKYAVIENGIVTNLVLSDAEFARVMNWVVCPDDVLIGWSYVNNAFTPNETQSS